ncbi:MAG: phage tail protein [Oscillospiraceae bacterium]|jgi:phage tail-like protein|nr:phage tail protein [Oscillospiraceae bacterium]
MPYPLKAYNFNVAVTGGTAAPTAGATDVGSGIGGGFSEVQGLEISHGLIVYRDGNSPLNTVIQFPGLTTYSNVTLKWGATVNVSFYNWVVATAMAGSKLLKSTVVITQLDDDHSTVLATWQLQDAFPYKYVASGFNAAENAFLFEAVELCHQGLTRIGGVAAGA